MRRRMQCRRKLLSRARRSRSHRAGDAYRPRVHAWSCRHRSLRSTRGGQERSKDPVGNHSQPGDLTEWAGKPAASRPRRHKRGVPTPKMKRTDETGSPRSYKGTPPTPQATLLPKQAAAKDEQSGRARGGEMRTTTRSVLSAACFALKFLTPRYTQLLFAAPCCASWSFSLSG